MTDGREDRRLRCDLVVALLSTDGEFPVSSTISASSTGVGAREGGMQGRGGAFMAGSGWPTICDPILICGSAPLVLVELSAGGMIHAHAKSTSDISMPVASSCSKAGREWN